MMRIVSIVLLLIAGLAVAGVVVMRLPNQQESSLLDDSTGSPVPLSSSMNPINTRTVTSPPIGLGKAAAACADLQQRIDAELVKVNYCTSDSECSSATVLKRGEDGEHRCGDAVPNYYSNKNANTTTLKQLGQQYAASQCPASPPGGCPGPRQDEVARVACVNKQCVLTFVPK